jgi:hypothetical protein
MTIGYDLSLEVHEIDPKRWEAVVQAAGDLWNFDGRWELDEVEGSISAEGQGTLTISASVRAFHDDITRAIWTANSGYCSVSTRFINLDEGPEFGSSPEDYERVMKKGHKPQKAG